LDRDRASAKAGNRFIVFQWDTFFINPPMALEDIELYQLGDTCGDPGYGNDSHVQLCHELILLLDGEAVMALNGRPYRIGGGGAVFLRKGTSHDILAVGKSPMHMMYIGFMCAPQAAKWLSDFVEKEPIRIASDAHALRPLFEFAMAEYDAKDAMRLPALAALLRLLVILAFRLFQSMPAPSYLLADELIDADNELVRRLTDYIRQNAASIGRLTNVAERFNYSYSHLSHVFAAATGLTLHEFWDRCRFQRAMDMMRDPDITLTRIAQELNFQSIQTFSRAFHQYFGMPPSRCQRMLRNL
jgi:AraC-like DNA-binding protein